MSFFRELCIAAGWTLALAAAPRAGEDGDREDDDPARRLAAMPRTHPRLLGGPEAFAAIRDVVLATPEGRRLADQVLEDAHAFLDAPLVERPAGLRRMLPVSRGVLRRSLVLGMAYQITGRPAFAERLAKELRAVAAMRDWNPGHFLDTAELALGVAVGYDWIHDALSDVDRAAIRRALVEKALQAAPGPAAHWVAGKGNWTQVCHAGMVAAALAAPDENPDLAVAALRSALARVPRAMRHGYAPDGGYAEGPMYWYFGTTYNILMIAFCEAALGTDFGLAENAVPDRAFERSAEWLLAMGTPTGAVFDFGDCRPLGREYDAFEPAAWWFAKRFGRPELAAAETRRLLAREGRDRDPARFPGRHAPLGLLWHPAPASEAPVAARFDLYRGPTPVAAYHEPSGGPGAFYFAAKGGLAGAAHMHMDAGAFVLESDGVRWAVDPGTHDYARLEAHGVAVFDNGQSGPRWDILRFNHLSHSVVTLDGRPFAVNGRAEIVEFNDDPRAPGLVIDTTPVYGRALRAARRRFDALPAEKSLNVVDTLSGMSPGTAVRWGLATRARARIVDAGHALLEQDGRRYGVTADAVDGAGGPLAGAWRIHDLSRPPNPAEDPLPGLVLLGYAFSAPASGGAVIRVRFAPAPDPAETTPGRPGHDER